MGYAHAIGDLEFAVGYNLIKIWTGEAEENPDHEFFASLVYPLGEYAEATCDFVYGRAAGGSHVECGLAHTLPAPAPFSWDLHAIVGWDFGYASEAFDGISHGIIGTTVEWEFSEDAAIDLFADLFLPFEDVERDGGPAQLVYGLHGTYRF